MFSRGWVLLLPVAAFGQDAFLAGWNQARAEAPVGLEFTISMPKTSFYVGEPIPFTLSFTSQRARTFVGHNWDMTACEDTFLDRAAVSLGPRFFVSDPGYGRPIAEEPVTYPRTLNDCFLFREPGVYRVYVRNGLVINQAEPSPVFRQAVSNVLTFQIQPAPPAWVAKQIGDAREELKKTPSPDAINKLVWLDTPESLDALTPFLGKRGFESGALYRAVPETNHPAQLLNAMVARLALPDVEVSGNIMGLITKLGRRVGTDQSAWTRLFDSLSSKTPAGRAVTLMTLLQQARYARPAPGWLPQAEAALLRNFPDFPALERGSFLHQDWPILKSREMADVLRKAHAADPTFTWDNFSAYVRTLPALAREFAVEEIRHPTKNVKYPARAPNWSVLWQLPDADLPELDEDFADYLKRGIDEYMVGRYASPAVLEAVKRNYQDRASHNMLCVSPVLLYFFKYDPVFAEQEVRDNVTSCGSMGWPLDMQRPPEPMQRLALEYLPKGSVGVKTEAARILMGNAPAREALWTAMEKFHAAWAGRARELENNPENLQLEQVLMFALIVADREEGARLMKLCTSEACAKRVSQTNVFGLERQ